ncbi:DUF4231 domain-containing protein [Streptomyces specialis]|uniref:DUF4231 domain-containing protein n=1 Tax=Streptomyces specialis TaxID=498367 RepID=UPI00131D6E25|nr:DUF4231 domain-containing protein [Streptomyces specialis]
MTSGSGGRPGTPYPAGLSEEEERELQASYRGFAKTFDEAENDLKVARGRQRIYLLSQLGTATLTFLLGYTVIVGLWQDQPFATRYAGLVIVVGVWAGMGRLFWINRNRIVEKNAQLRNALFDRQTAAAKLPLDSPSGLRIYREASLDLIEQYRKGAARNRRVHNFFQVVIITGSITTSTLTAMNEGSNLALRIVTSALSALVGVSAGITGYFKFRERGYNLQSTADDIEKHYNASQFMLDEYAAADAAHPLTEHERLRMFARFVERLKEEQRKRELQLEQQSSVRDDRSS